MARKGVNERMRPVQIYFSEEQLAWLDGVSNYSRGEVVRRCVNLVRRQDTIRLDAQERQSDLGMNVRTEFATNMDFEIILDTYAYLFVEPLKEASSNGHDISTLIPTFMGLIEKNLNKNTTEQRVGRFLHEKMEELSVTNPL